MPDSTLHNLAGTSSHRRYATAAFTLEADDHVVVADTTAGAMTITVPPAANGFLGIYSFHLHTDGGDLTLAFQDDHEPIVITDKVLDTVADYAVMFTDGIAWYVLAEEIKP